MPEAQTTEGANPLLSPIVERWRSKPEAVFAVYLEPGGERPVRQAELRERALRFLALLRAHGGRGGGLVLLILEHGLDAHAAFLGAMLGGMIPSFLPYPNPRQDARLYWQHHRALFELCGPCLVVVFDALHDAVREAAAATVADIIPQSAVEEVAPAAEPATMPAASTTALLQHSSGTTGLKKGVALPYSSIATQLECYAAALNLAHVANPVIATWLPLYHDMGLVSSFLLPCWSGIPIVSLDPFRWIASPTTLLDVIERRGATHVWLPNFAFLVLARSARGARRWNLGHLRALIGCSEPCKHEAYEAFAERFVPMGLPREVLQTCYAMAETVFAVTQSALGASVRRLPVSRRALLDGIVSTPVDASDTLLLLSNGRPIPQTEVRIAGEAAFTGRVGEILVRSEFMFAGYHGNAEATRAAWENGWYRTGDLGFLQDGELFVVGRIKDVIIVNGRNLFAHDVEAAVATVGGVKPGRCVALGEYAERTGSEQLVVLAERDPLVALNDPETIRAISYAVLQECGVPCADIQLVPPGWLVKTTSGKMSRVENALRYRAMQGAPAEAAACSA